MRMDKNIEQKKAYREQPHIKERAKMLRKKRMENPKLKEKYREKQRLYAKDKYYKDPDERKRKVLYNQRQDVKDRNKVNHKKRMEENPEIKKKIRERDRLYNSHRYQNNPAYKERQMKATKNKYNKPPFTSKETYYRAKYNIAVGEYNVLLDSQNGLCAICGNPPTKRSLAVDHSHITGKVRGLLCHKCNVSLGLVNEKISILEKMIEYIKKFNN